MWSCATKVAAQTAVHLGWVHGRLQVVGYRDDWEQEQNEHGQSYELHPPVRTGARTGSHPLPANQHRKKKPNDV
jgi:hypothetical protein